MGPFGNQTECGQHNVTYKNGDDWGMVDGITPLFYPPFSTTGWKSMDEKPGDLDVNHIIAKWMKTIDRFEVI